MSLQLSYRAACLYHHSELLPWTDTAQPSWGEMGGRGGGGLESLRRKFVVLVSLALQETLSKGFIPK